MELKKFVALAKWQATGAVIANPEPEQSVWNLRREGVVDRDRLVSMNDRISGMVHGGKSKDDVKATLIADFGWQATGIGANSIDGLIAELKT